MGTMLDYYDFEKPSVMTTGAKATYPWDDWLRPGTIWRLVYGKDFQPHPLMMERIIRTRATGRGTKVELRHEPLKDPAIDRLIKKLRKAAEAAEGKDADLLNEAAEALATLNENPFGAIVLRRSDVPAPRKPTAKKAAAKKAPAKHAAKKAPAAKKANGTQRTGLHRPMPTKPPPGVRRRVVKKAPA